MGDLYPSVSPYRVVTAHSGRVGVASPMTENKHNSSQTTDISYERDKDFLCLPAPRCVPFFSLAWAAW